MRDLVLKYKEKYEELSFREQIMIMISALTLLGLIWFLYLYEPLYLKTKSASSDLVPLKSNINKLVAQKKQLESRRDTDPHLDIKKRITLVSNELEKLNTELDEKFHGLITPKKMARVLESVLRQQSTLKLVSVQSLQSESLIKKSEKSDDEIQEQEKNKVEVYRHGMQIEFEGNYLSALKYLQTLESLDWEFYWDDVILEVTDYPKARIIITVHTLSLRDFWIGV